MMKIEEKFAASEFTVPTALSFAEVLAASDDASTRAGKLLTNIKRTDVLDGAAVQYVATTAGMVKAGVFIVHYQAASPSQSATIRLEAEWYMTSQSTVLFIPVGPKDSNALGPFRAFSKALLSAVSRADVPGSSS